MTVYLNGKALHDKLQTSFLEEVFKEVLETKVHGTVSGRFNSSKPNCGQVPQSVRKMNLKKEFERQEA